MGQVEGTKQQTGLILQTPGVQSGSIPVLAVLASQVAPPLNNNQELIMKALHPPEKQTASQIITLNLIGKMHPYAWMINDKAWPNVPPIAIKPNARVVFVFNEAGMMTYIFY